MRTLFLTLAICLPFSFGFALQTTIYDIQVEGKKNPLGVGTPTPHFSWKIKSTLHQLEQTDYHIKVATDPSFDSAYLVWDSGKVYSNQSLYVPYSGNALTSNQTYYWSVEVWNTQERKSAKSTTGKWSMGIMSEKEWIAQWITQTKSDNDSRRSPYFKKDFSVSKKIKTAYLHISAQGMYEAYLNGEKVGNEFLTPGWTAYDDRIQYQTYEVSNHLKTTNALGVVLGSGWHRGYLAWSDNKNSYGDSLALIAQLHITYEDGTSETILSDNSWSYTHGAIIDSELYDGEFYNGLLETDWCEYGKPLKDSRKAQQAADVKNRLVATHNERITAHEVFTPLKKITTPSGDTVLDFGQNLVGWVEFSNVGKRGDTLKMYHAEILDKAGEFYTENLRAAAQLNTYILNGDADRVYRPHFTFQGFRYIKIEGIEDFDLDEFKAVALYSDMETTGYFSTSNPLINQLQKNIQWGQKGNFLDVPTDCPQRDERLGWTGDAQAFYNTATFNMGVKNFFEKWLIDLSLDQREDGSVPFVIPNVLGNDAAGSAGWADAATIIPYNHYVAYGDKSALEQQYPSMKNWVEYMYGLSENGKYTGTFHFGDWLFYRPNDDNDGRSAVTSKELIAQCFYARSTEIVRDAARILGRESEAQEYDERLKQIKAVFLNEFVTPSGRLISETQTAYVLALYFDMFPENLRAQAAKRLVDNIKSYNTHLTTGFLGTPYLCHVLSENGYSEVAIALLLQESYPSWLYPITQGATTIWERWDGIKPDGSTQTPSMNSYNHYAYGAIGEWMYSHLLGIQVDPTHPGFKHFVLQPLFDSHFESIEGHFESPYGKIEVAWRYQEDAIRFDFEIPGNTTSTVQLPEGFSWKRKLKNKWVPVVSNSTLGSGKYEMIGSKM